MRPALAVLLVAPPLAAACLIQGTVVDASTSRSIDKAQVFAKPDDWHKAAILRLSGAQGQFCFERLDAGSYSVMAVAPGYLQQVYGARPGRDQGASFHIADDAAISPLTLKLQRPASIGGMIVDAGGEPVENFRVELLRKIWDKGWDSDTVTMTTSDDRGMFRFSGLASGTYYLSAEPLGAVRSILDERGNPAPTVRTATFYSGSPNFAHAAAVYVEPGEEHGNLVLTLLPTPLRALSGRLSNSLHLTPGNGAILSLWPGSAKHSTEIPIQPDGTFSAHNLEADRYTARLSIDSRPQFTFDLTESDITGLVLEPKRTYTIRPVVMMDGHPAAGSFSIDALDTESGTVEPAELDGRGNLTLWDIPAGLWRLSGTGDGLYLKSLIIDGKARSDTLLDLRSAEPSKVEAVMSRDVARIEGSVDHPENSTLAVTVVWIDEAKSRHEASGNWVSPDHTGKFTVESLAPGRYRLFAIEGFDADLWGSPELIASLREKSVALELKEGESRKLTIPVISFDDWIAALKKAGM